MKINSYILERASMGLPIDTSDKPPAFHKLKDRFKKEVVRSWNLRFRNVFSYVLDRYNHIIYVLICRKHRRKDKMNLLKPQFSFYLMIWTMPVFIIWLFSIFIVGTDLTLTIGLAGGYGILVSILGS